MPVEAISQSTRLDEGKASIAGESADERATAFSLSSLGGRRGRGRGGPSCLRIALAARIRVSLSTNSPAAGGTPAPPASWFSISSRNSDTARDNSAVRAGASPSQNG